MRFTTPAFLASASQAMAHQNSSSPRNDDSPEQSSVVYSIDERESVCDGYCRHTYCRTYRPVPQRPRPTCTDAHAPPLKPLGLVSASHIYAVHEKLADLQQTVDIRKQLIELAYQFPGRYQLDSSRTRAYRASANLQNNDFESLLAEIKRSVVYFGHISLPKRREFTDAVKDALFEEEIAREQLLEWHDRAEDLQKEAHNYSEWSFENNEYWHPGGGIFDPEWSFANSNAGGERTSIEEVAPDAGPPPSDG